MCIIFHSSFFSLLSCDSNSSSITTGKKMIKNFLVLLACFGAIAIGIEAFGLDPSSNRPTQFPYKIYVDCNAGSDSEGDGSSEHPFATMTYVTDNNSGFVNGCYIDIIVRNGPCDEPTHIITNGFRYFGNDSSPIVIANGFDYTSIGGEFTGFEFVNLYITELNLNVEMMQPNWDLKFFGCTIISGNIIGTRGVSQYAGSFYGCNIILNSTTGLTSFYDSYSQIAYVGYQGDLLISGGVISGTVNMGPQAIVHFVGNYVGFPTFISKETDFNKPTAVMGSTTINTFATFTGLNIVRYPSNSFQRNQGFIATTIGDDGTVTISLPEPVYNIYQVSLELSSSSSIAPWVSDKSYNNFVIHGTPGSTLNYIIIKQ